MSSIKVSFPNHGNPAVTDGPLVLHGDRAGTVLVLTGSQELQYERPGDSPGLTQIRNSGHFKMYRIFPSLLLEGGE